MYSIVPKTKVYIKQIWMYTYIITDRATVEYKCPLANATAPPQKTVENIAQAPDFDSAVAIRTCVRSRTEPPARPTSVANNAPRLTVRVSRFSESKPFLLGSRNTRTSAKTIDVGSLASPCRPEFSLSSPVKSQTERSKYLVWIMHGQLRTIYLAYGCLTSIALILQMRT